MSSNVKLIQLIDDNIHESLEASGCPFYHFREFQAAKIKSYSDSESEWRFFVDVQKEINKQNLVGAGYRSELLSSLIAEKQRRLIETSDYSDTGLESITRRIEKTKLENSGSVPLYGELHDESKSSAIRFEATTARNMIQAGFEDSFRTRKLLIKDIQKNSFPLSKYLAKKSKKNQLVFGRELRNGRLLSLAFDAEFFRDREPGVFLLNKPLWLEGKYKLVSSCSLESPENKGTIKRTSFSLTHLFMFDYRLVPSFIQMCNSLHDLESFTRLHLYLFESLYELLNEES